MARPLHPSPSLNGPAIKRRTFFGGFPNAPALDPNFCIYLFYASLGSALVNEYVYLE